MNLSVFDLFKIGIGPSSSHTVGPMKAAGRFLAELQTRTPLDRIRAVRIDLYGSLALTGKGHATDKAVILGLTGETPEHVDPDTVDAQVALCRENASLRLGGIHPIPFVESEHLRFLTHEILPEHPNGITFSAWVTPDSEPILRCTYFSVGGGFVVSLAEMHEQNRTDDDTSAAPKEPHPFAAAADLLRIGQKTGLSFADIVRANERMRHDDAAIDAGLDRIWETMHACMERGYRQEGVLPGGLSVRRRAPGLYRRLLLTTQGHGLGPDPLSVLDWVSVFALAVNEENAAGGRVVTAPTNGAAGVIPAVLAYATRFLPDVDAKRRRDFLLTAAAVGMLYKRNASLSAAEVGCQGEVGVACSMAAAGLAAIMGGTNEQIENAAEIGMEHHLGLTCDPIAGLVQIPCIERNTMGAAKAINSARLALHGDGSHHVSLDRVIATMRQTGLDMQAKYKETSLGGLAVNFVEC